MPSKEWGHTATSGWQRNADAHARTHTVATLTPDGAQTTPPASNTLEPGRKRRPCAPFHGCSHPTQCSSERRTPHALHEGMHGAGAILQHNVRARQQRLQLATDEETRDVRCGRGRALCHTDVQHTASSEAHAHTGHSQWLRQGCTHARRPHTVVCGALMGKAGQQGMRQWHTLWMGLGTVGIRPHTDALALLKQQRHRRTKPARVCAGSDSYSSCPRSRNGKEAAGTSRPEGTCCRTQMQEAATATQGHGHSKWDRMPPAARCRHTIHTHAHTFKLLVITELAASNA
jgi:hypothetical protein